MSSDTSVDDKELKDQIEETIKYLSFSVKQDTTTTGTMGFKMQSKSGEDMSFVVRIDNTEDGVIAKGQFGDPSNADVVVTVPAEDFVRIYTGDADLSAVTSLVLRGKISVRNFDLNGVSRFMGSFEFSSQKWNDYYAYRDRVDNCEKKISHLHHLLQNFRSNPITMIHQLYYSNTVFEHMYMDHYRLPSLHDYSIHLPSVHNTRIPSVLSTTSLPSLDIEMEEDVVSVDSYQYDEQTPTPEPPQDTSLPCRRNPVLRTLPTPLSEPVSSIFPTPPLFLREAINSLDTALPNITDLDEPTMFSEDSTVNMWEGIEFPKAFHRLESFFRRRLFHPHNQLSKPFLFVCWILFY